MQVTDLMRYLSSPLQTDTTEGAVVWIQTLMRWQAITFPDSD